LVQMAAAHCSLDCPYDLASLLGGVWIEDFHTLFRLRFPIDSDFMPWEKAYLWAESLGCLKHILPRLVQCFRICLTKIIACLVDIRAITFFLWTAWLVRKGRCALSGYRPHIYILNEAALRAGLALPGNYQYHRECTHTQ